MGYFVPASDGSVYLMIGIRVHISRKVVLPLNFLLHLVWRECLEA